PPAETRAGVRPALVFLGDRLRGPPLARDWCHQARCFRCVATRRRSGRLRTRAPHGASEVTWLLANRLTNEIKRSCKSLVSARSRKPPGRKVRQGFRSLLLS